MERKESRRYRKSAKLHVERLEERVAPAVLTPLAPTWNFTDSDGDNYSFDLGGSGSIGIYGNIDGSDPSDTQDVAYIVFNGTTTSSTLTITLTNPGVGNDDFVGGQWMFVDGVKSPIGQVTLDDGGAAASIVQDILMEPGNIVNLFILQDTVRNCVFEYLAKSAPTIDIDGSLENNSQIIAHKTVTQIDIGGGMTNSDIAIGRDSKLLTIHGIMDRSNVTIGGKAGPLNVLGGVTDSTIHVAREAGIITINGGMTGSGGNPTSVEIGKKVKALNIDGLIDGGGGGGGNTSVLVYGDAGTVSLTGPVLGDSMINGAVMEIGGKVTALNIAGALDDASVVIHGMGGTLQFGDVVAGSGVIFYGSVKACNFTGSVTDALIRVAGSGGAVTFSQTITGSTFEALTRLKSFTVMGDIHGSQLDMYGAVGKIYVTGDFGGATGISDPSDLWIGNTIGLLHVQGDIVGYGTTWTPSTIDVEGHLRKLQIGDPLNLGSGAGWFIDSELNVECDAGTIWADGSFQSTDPASGRALFNIEGTSSNFAIHGNVDAVDIQVGLLGTFTVGTLGVPATGNMFGDALLSVRERAKKIIILGDLGEAGGGTGGDIRVDDALDYLSVQGANGIVVSQIDVGDLFKKLEVTQGDIGSAATTVQINTHGLSLAEVSQGLIYGEINVYGSLKDIISQGANANAGVPPFDVPFTGSFLFRESGGAGGAPTGGVVNYVKWIGATVS